MLPSVCHMKSTMSSIIPVCFYSWPHMSCTQTESHIQISCLTTRETRNSSQTSYPNNMYYLTITMDAKTLRWTITTCIDHYEISSFTQITPLYWVGLMGMAKTQCCLSLWTAVMAYFLLWVFWMSYRRGKGDYFSLLVHGCHLSSSSS